nr:hypothetical protein Q903MT_gene4938 [Picea sitchensis]
MRLGLGQLHRSLPPRMTNRERTSQLELLDLLRHCRMVPERMRKGLLPGYSLCCFLLSRLCLSCLSACWWCPRP